MPKYTTGELAKLCDVSVRTVQYYDDRGILVPSALSEGGRRLYSEEDLKRMHVICFLREVGLPINSIAALLAEEKPEATVSILLDEQERLLRDELEECGNRLALIRGIRQGMKGVASFSVDTIGDIAKILKQKEKLRKMRLAALLTGLPVTALQWVSIILWITHGFFWLFPIWVCVSISWGILASRHYFTHVAFICPECHEIFRPHYREAFFAYHTLKMRRLTCPRCARHGLCVEVYAEKENKRHE